VLVIISTPIGNLADLSYRAVETLQQSDLILCEDTRHSGILLSHYQIKKPLLAFHQFNEKEKESHIFNELEKGKQVALISDAGTPLISDPGEALVKSCIARNIPITAIPGACSPIQALLLSGFETARFQFIGFLPREKNKISEVLHRALFYKGTTIAFESPRRLLKTLLKINRLNPTREIAIARELTKIYEECRRGTASELLNHYSTQEPRGEIILLIREGNMEHDEIELEELLKLLQELHGLTLKEAIKLAAKVKKIPKKVVYQSVHG